MADKRYAGVAHVRYRVAGGSRGGADRRHRRGPAIISHHLPQRRQEGLETVVGGIAVLMVTYMVLWMRRHARDLKGDLEKAAGSALAEGSSKAVVIGYGIYKGGVHINLSRFFRITGVALVVIAAGLVMTGVHTANEAGWLNFGQTQALDLSWLVRPGTPLESFVTGVFGIQPYPVDVEFVAWVAYLIPMLVVMFWPSRQRSRPVPVVADPVESGSRRAERASLPAV